MFVRINSPVPSTVTSNEEENDKKCCGRWSSRMGARVVLWIYAFELVSHVLAFLSDKLDRKHSTEVNIIFAASATIATIVIVLGILGEITENSNYIKLFYGFQFVVLIGFIWALLSLPLQTRSLTGEEQREVFVVAVALGLQIYLIIVIKRYHNRLKSGEENDPPIDSV